MKRSHAVAALAAAMALAAPAAADAAGTVSTNGSGTVTYTGDGTANVVNATITAEGSSKNKVVFTETGIAEGTDSADICVPGTNTVTCTYDTGNNIFLKGEGEADSITVDSAVAYPNIDGGAGNDHLVGGDLNDQLNGGPGEDTLEGRFGNDFMHGDAGTDVVLGGDGNDSSIIDLGDGDRIDLGSGRDVFWVNNADGNGDTLDGGPGTDLLLFLSYGGATEKPYATIDLAKGVAAWKDFENHPAVSDSLAGIEDVGAFSGTLGDDTLIGNAESNLLAGGYGSDTIVGGPGTDTLLSDRAGVGIDYFMDQPGGADTVDAVDGFADRVDCGGGTDVLKADQFDGPAASGCDSAETTTVDPFGIPAPQPTTPQPTTPQPTTPTDGNQGGGPQGGGERPRDVEAPRCTHDKLPVQKRSTVLKRGFSVGVICNEPARLDITASRGRLLLATSYTEMVTGKRTLKFKVPRELRRVLPKKLTIRLRIDATDSSGNRTSRFAKFAVK
jgi:hypothetical protein